MPAIGRHCMTLQHACNHITMLVRRFPARTVQNIERPVSRSQNARNTNLPCDPVL